MHTGNKSKHLRSGYLTPQEGHKLQSPPQKAAGYSGKLWYEVDASSHSLGRVASAIANILRGKIKRDFTPNMDMGDFVVAVNTDKLIFTGRKIEQKKYYRHSGYLGGLKSSSLKDELNKNPGKVLQRAVFSMLDDVKFRKKMISRLKLIKGKSHNFKIDRVWPLK